LYIGKDYYMNNIWNWN